MNMILNGIILPKTITRVDLLEQINKEVGLSRHESGQLVEQILEEMSNAMIKGNAVKIFSFGSFLLRDKKERIGRNPRTGDEVTIAPRKVISFRASNILKQMMNEK